MRDFCSLPLRAHCCRTVSSSDHWKLLCYRFLHNPNTPAVLPVFLNSFANGLNLYFELLKAGSEKTGNGLFNGSERRNCLMAAPRSTSLMNFCKLTVCHHSSSQTCISSSVPSSFDISYIGFENLVPLGLASHSVTLRWKLLLQRNLHECVKSRCSCLKFWNFWKNLNVYVPLNMLIPNFMAFSFLLAWHCL